MRNQQQHSEAATPARLEGRASWLVSRAHTRANGLLAEGFEADGGGLRGYHYRLLAALDEWGPASQADLGRSVNLDRSDVTAAVTELENQGLVDRTVDTDDRRRNIVSITTAGTKRLAELDLVVAAVQERLLAPLSANERRQFVALLRRVVEG